MALVKKGGLTINIPGWHKNWVFRGLTLTQVYNDHHVFNISVEVPYPEVDRKDAARTPKLTPAALTDILGQPAELKISTEKHDHTLEFQGFVDEIAPVWMSRSCSLQVTGYSNSMLMDCGPCFRTFYEKSLSDVVQKVGSLYNTQGGVSFSGENIPCGFSVQNQETDYRYLCRLADGYGKVCYYDGRKLVFGDLKPNKNRKNKSLKWGEDIKQASMSLNTAPLNFKLSAYDVLKGEVLQPFANIDMHTDSNSMVNTVIRKSKVYPAPHIHMTSVYAQDKGEIDNRAQRMMAKQAHNLVTLHAGSDESDLTIGSIITIDNPEPFGIGEYLIVQISHSVSSDGNYSNSFTAIPANQSFPPRMQQSRSPLCGPLLAKVEDHNDPDKLGRVRVTFFGDEEKTLSPWLRVLTPHTGNGGMHFFPEKGDHVVVEAEDLNIEKYPFVSGAFFHGKAKPEKWKDTENKEKGFFTEKVKFFIDDRTGKLTIEAEDIEIIARNQLETKSKESVFKAERQMELNGGNHQTLKANRIDLNP